MAAHWNPALEAIRQFLHVVDTQFQTRVSTIKKRVEPFPYPVV
jgi:hypothetical protein